MQPDIAKKNTINTITIIQNTKYKNTITAKPKKPKPKARNLIYAILKARFRFKNFKIISFFFLSYG